MTFWDVSEVPVPGLSQFQATESPLKLMESPFYFTLKTLLILKIFKFLSCLYWSVRKTAR